MKKNYIGYVDSVQAEFATRVFSSRKRVIKFIAICFVPFLYAFICIWAFWDPIPKIGEAPMAIVSNDTPINFIVGKTAEDKLAAGEAEAYKEPGGELTPIGEDFDFDSLAPGTEIFTTAKTVIIKDGYTINSKTSLVDNLIDAWKAGSVENIKYDKNNDKFSIKVNEGMTLTNVRYLNGEEAKKVASQNQDGSWNVKDENKYWAQVQMPTRLSSDIIGYFDASLPSGGSRRPPSDFLNDLRKNSFQFWSTYKHNFLFGQFMYIFDEFKSSLIVDMGPQVISNLVKLIIESVIKDLQEDIFFTAPETVDEILTISDHGNPQSHDVRFNVTQGQKYVIRNQEISDAIKANHPSWSLPQLSVEGTTGIDITKDWELDGFLNKLAERWNELMQGEYGDYLASNLATSITNEINKEIASDQGTLTIDSEGVKKLFSTSGNIAGLLEQDGSLVPETNNNFEVTGTGEISNRIKNYKDLVTVANGTLHSKYNFISILSPDSKSSESAYVLPFGDIINPDSGTFNYNLQHNINILTHLIFGKNKPASLIGDRAFDEFFPDLSDFIKTNIVGSQFNPYGIGLGQFFLCIGLWVGTLMQTFVFDRAKRIKQAKPWAWYLSKTTLMLVTAWIQTTILMLTVYALGWSVIGPSFGLMYLWMMFTATVFVIIQQALWFSIQDETVGKFLVILLLIINLSSGWGTFPTFMQAPIFNFLSYFAPYTYSMHGQGAIIYSIAVNGVNLTDSLYILQQFGILIVWAVGFLIIGLLCSILRNREIFYGTYKSKKLGTILIEEKMNKYVDKKTKKAIWKKLPKEEMPKIRKKVRKRYPEEGQYQWFKKWNAKHHPDKPLTASESDDEIMRRND